MWQPQPDSLKLICQDFTTGLEGLEGFIRVSMITLAYLIICNNSRVFGIRLVGGVVLI